MVMPTEFAFSSIARSNIPREEKSELAKWVDKMTGGSLSEFSEDHKKGIKTLKKVVVGDLEGFLTGAAVGIAEGESESVIPSLAAAAIGNIAALASSGTRAEGHFCNMGTAGFAIFGRHVSRSLFYEKKLQGGSTTHGENNSEEDAVLAAAKKFL